VVSTQSTTRYQRVIFFFFFFFVEGTKQFSQHQWGLKEGLVGARMDHQDAPGRNGAGEE
jgi:hypothetical protein